MSVPYGQIVLEEGSLKLANVVTVSRGVLIVPILLLESYHHLGYAIVVYLAASTTDLIAIGLAGSERVRRHPRRHPRSAPRDGFSDGPGA